MNRSEWYRAIPKVDVLLEQEAVRTAACVYGHAVVMEAVRSETDSLRARIGSLPDDAPDAEERLKKAVDELPERIALKAKRLGEPDVRRVINATGVVLHTNLGRAPVSRAQAERLVEIASGYSNLEYDLEKGERGERYAHFADLLCRLTGAEAAMAVNNNAAAVMLVLSSLAKDGEVITSRGELVEIGGKFRIPDVCEASGAKLVEVGTTNRTHLSDYAEAVTENTKAFLKAHTSNFRIVGFTESVPVSDLAPLAREKGLPVIEDLGSGSLVDLTRFGLPYEPTVQEAVASGADIVTFSGDKLLGGPQAGIIVGKKTYIDRIKKNPLTRALRIDKFTVTALELALLAYTDEEKAVRKIPALSMLGTPAEELRARAEELKEELTHRLNRNGASDGAPCPARFEVVPCAAQPGGGSLPTAELPGFGLSAVPEHMTVNELERALRAAEHPAVARIADDAVLFDMRTVFPEEIPLLAGTIAEALGAGSFACGKETESGAERAALDGGEVSA